MLENNRRRRIVSFRVSEEEYRALRGYSARNGISSVSELARAAIRQYLDAGDAHNGDYEMKLRRIQDRLSLLDLAVERLAQLVESRGGDGG